LEPKRPVRETVWLIDIDDEMPPAGACVLALGLGGKLCETVWNKKSAEFFVAWMPYPSEPRKVKDKLSRLYLAGIGPYG
jgi:hypothetical protein